MPKTSASPPAGVEAIRDLLDRNGIGVVYTVPGDHRRASNATICVAETRRRSPGAEILLDASLYSGTTRKQAAAGIDPAWLNHQHRDGLTWALTDSGYIGDTDLAGLDTVLTQAAREHDRAQARGKGVVAALPLAISWLTERADELAARVRTAAIPVAVMLEHTDDPLGVEHAVDGLVELLSCGAPVAVLRCDTSVLGALAYGSVVVSVGDSSSTRHFYPIPKRKGGPPGPVPAATLVPELLAYVRLDKIDDAITAAPGLGVWMCDCRVCGHQRLDWISNSTEPRVSAFEHAVSSLADTGRELFNNISAPARPASWASAVRHARANHAAIVARDGRPWKPPTMLRRWLGHYERSNLPTDVPVS
jgi:hypothetical protein